MEGCAWSPGPVFASPHGGLGGHVLIEPKGHQGTSQENKMKLEIYEPKTGIKEEEPVRLALKQNGKSICLHVVDAEGERVPRGNLLDITSEGYVYFHVDVRETFGFQLDENKKLRRNEV